MNSKQYRNTADLFLIVAAIVILAGLLAFATGKAGASSAVYGTGRSEACRTYSISGPFRGVDNMDASHCGEGEQASKQEGEDNTPSIVNTPVPTQPTQPTQPAVTPQPTQIVIVTTSTPVIIVVTDVPTQQPTEQTETVHCNKGEGNGGEGCDPGNNPDKGNNDED